MKTIDINLIEHIEKSSDKKKNNKNNENTLDPKAKLISITLVVGACVGFLVCDGIWFFAYHSTKKANLEIKDLETKQNNLRKEITESETNVKYLKNQKKILELKSLAQKQIQSSLLPWQNIMNNIANAVPKDIKITNIAKENGLEHPMLTINGQINSVKSLKANPLEEISFFALNLNGCPLLSNPVIKKIEYKKEQNSYEFVIETQINITSKPIVK